MLGQFEAAEASSTVNSTSAFGRYSIFLEASDLPLAKTNLVRDFLTTFHIQDKVVPGFDCEERGEQSLSAEHIVMETEGPALPQKQSEFQPTHKPN